MARIQDMFSKWLSKSPKPRLKARHLAAMEPERVFETIYENNAWKGSQSVSGTGSDSQQTSRVAMELPRVLHDLEARSILDIPCGDFFWMQDVDLDGVKYIGADIVESLVQSNQRFTNESRAFVHCNLLTDELPSVDVIFCRDCLVHFKSEHVWQALENIASSAAKYLITTTFVERANEKQIQTGQWRPLNLQAEPFSFSSPIELIDEQCTQDDGAYPDKMLGVWSIDAIREAVMQSGRRAA